MIGMAAVIAGTPLHRLRLKLCGILANFTPLRLSDSLQPLLILALAETCTACTVSLSRSQMSRIAFALRAIASIFSRSMLVIASPIFVVCLELRFPKQFPSSGKPNGQPSSSQGILAR
jgi:hypothetical protein